MGTRTRADNRRTRARSPLAEASPTGGRQRREETRKESRKETRTRRGIDEEYDSNVQRQKRAMEGGGDEDKDSNEDKDKQGRGSKYLLYYYLK